MTPAPSPEPAAVPAPVLELRDVHAAYGRIEVLHGVDLVVPPSSVVALLGPNGAGKSTTLAVASGRLRPTAGCVHVSGRHVNGARPDALARVGVCTVPEGRAVFPNLTVAENLRLATFSGVPADEVEEDAYARFPVLRDRRSQLAGSLSGGEQQMLGLGRALASRPALLLLDELSMGLAPMVVRRLYDAVAEVAATGVSVLVVEQFARVVLGVADYVVVLSNGRVTALGQPADVEDVLPAAYLGAPSTSVSESTA